MNAPSEARHKRTDLSNEADAINLKNKREISEKKTPLIPLNIGRYESMSYYLISGEYLTSFTTF